jgi:hypothetical protein
VEFKRVEKKNKEKEKEKKKKIVGFMLWRIMLQALPERIGMSRLLYGQ